MAAGMRLPASPALLSMPYSAFSLCSAKVPTLRQRLISAATSSRYPVPGSSGSTERSGERPGVGDAVAVERMAASEPGSLRVSRCRFEAGHPGRMPIA
ncbi:hypothetical protein SAMN04487983_104165 [Streptomyces sp. yr375]|nr:hypothetical protein SAMN04487983_104165 [Streptomyces sp. yr375]